MNKDERAALKMRLMAAITKHVGKTRCISMVNLYRHVFQKDEGDKINGTRRLRDLVTELRDEGIPIVSSISRTGGGYYLASTASDLDDYCGKLKTKALKLLNRMSKLRGMALPELLGQMSIEAGNGPGPADAVRQAQTLKRQIEDMNGGNGNGKK